MNLRRATGEVAFSGDLAVPGLLHVSLRRSPLAHARVDEIDASEARGLQGVAAVATCEEAPRLLSRELLFFGDRLAVVAAEDPEVARRALDAIRIRLAPLPLVLDSDGGRDTDPTVAARLSLAEGDLDAELATAEQVIEGDWHLPWVPAVSLEPPQATTWLDEDHRLVVRTSAESPLRVRSLLAERLSLPAAGIRVVRPQVAGGAEGAAVLIEDLCAWVTLHTGRPARLKLTGEDQLATSPARPALRVHLRLGLRDAQMVSLDLRFRVDLGAGATHEDADALLRSAARRALGVYGVKTIRLEAVAVRTNRPPAGHARGSDAGPAFAVECAVDEAASRSHEDPTAFRYRHLRVPGTPGHRLLDELGEPSGCDDATAAKALFALLPRGARRVRVDPTVRSGAGIAVARHSPARPASAGPAASLRLLDDGSFALAAAATTGGADEHAYVEAAAQILTVSADRIVCTAADTDSSAFESADPLGAPFAAGLAVEQAARLAREKIREVAARLLGAPLAETIVADGTARAKDLGALGFAEIGAAALRLGAPVVVTGFAAPAAVPLSLAAAHADVAVDADTGAVRVRQLHVAIAAGPAGDSLAHQARIEGALTAAVEQALAAAMPFDDQGRPVLRSLREWPLAAAIDVPPLSIAFAPAIAGQSSLETGAVSDVCTQAALAAIANAVARATGGRVRTLPLTPPAVLDLIDATSVE